MGSLYWGGHPDRDSLGRRITGTVNSPILGRQSQKALGPDGAIWGGGALAKSGVGALAGPAFPCSHCPLHRGPLVRCPE